MSPGSFCNVGWLDVLLGENKKGKQNATNFAAAGLKESEWPFPELHF